MLLVAILAAYGYLQLVKKDDVQAASELQPNVLDPFTDQNGMLEHSVNVKDVALLKAYDEALLIELNESHTLEQAIQIAKQKQQELVGEDDLEQFSQQRQRMDMALWIQSLARNSQHAGEMPEQALTAVINKSKQANETDDQAYQYAQMLYQQLGIELTPATNKLLIEKIYTGVPLKNMLEFETRHESQIKQRDDYQQRYQVLLQTLAEQRQAQYSSLTEVEWSIIKHSRIKQFKLAYFK